MYNLPFTLWFKTVAMGNCIQYPVINQNRKEYTYNWATLLYSRNEHNLVHQLCGSGTKSCLTLCDPMDCSTSGFPVLHCLPEMPTCPRGCIKWHGCTYIWIAESLRCSPETITALLIGYNLIQNEFVFFLMHWHATNDWWLPLVLWKSSK